MKIHLKFTFPEQKIYKRHPSLHEMIQVLKIRTFGAPELAKSEGNKIHPTRNVSYQRACSKITLEEILIFIPDTYNYTLNPPVSAEFFTTLQEKTLEEFTITITVKLLNQSQINYLISRFETAPNELLSRLDLEFGQGMIELTPLEVQHILYMKEF